MHSEDKLLELRILSLLFRDMPHSSFSLIYWYICLLCFGPMPLPLLSLVSLDSFGFKNEVHPDCGASWLAAQEPASNNDSILWPYIPELLSIQGLFMFCMSESLFLGRSDLHPSLLRCLSWRTDSLISRIQVLYPFPVTWSLILLAKFLVLLLLPQATMSYGKNT